VSVARLGHAVDGGGGGGLCLLMSLCPCFLPSESSLPWYLYKIFPSSPAPAPAPDRNTAEMASRPIRQGTHSTALSSTRDGENAFLCRAIRPWVARQVLVVVLVRACEVYSRGPFRFGGFRFETRFVARGSWFVLVRGARAGAGWG
jgi:hypothetical protein